MTDTTIEIINLVSRVILLAIFGFVAWVAWYSDNRLAYLGFLILSGTSLIDAIISAVKLWLWRRA